MKKLILSSFFLAGALASSAQYNVVNGTVLDCHGDPVIGQPVHVIGDSLPALGYAYFNVVYTNAIGVFTDTVAYPGTASSIHVSTQDIYTWHSATVFPASSGNVYNLPAFNITCDTVIPDYDTIHSTIHGWVYDCHGNLVTGQDVVYLADSSYGVYSSGVTSSNPISGYYAFQVSYSGAATLPFPVYVYVPNTPYFGYTVDTIYVGGDTILHDIHTSCDPLPCTASFWSYYDSTGTSGNDTIYLMLNYTTMNPGSTTVNWDFGDGNTETGVNTIHVYDANGLYNVCVTVDNAVDSCNVTYCDTIAFVTRATGYVIKTMPAAGSALGVNEPVKEETTFNVYPNPASSQVNVQSNTAISSAALFDLSGRQVMGQNLSGAQSNLSLDIQNIEKGTYLLVLYNQNKELIHTHTVLKH